MLKLSGISKRFGSRSVLNGVGFVLNPGDVGGLVAPSGAGKTTLLRIIAGEERASAGSVERSPGLRLGYLRQGYAGAEGRPLREVFPAAFAAIDGAQTAERLAQQLAEATGPEADHLALAYEGALARLESAAPVEAIARARHHLGLRAVDPDEPAGALSGGEQTKLGLVELVASRPDILLLDEPTNNLDVAGLIWLDAFLGGFAGAVLLVSHDRAMLDAHATMILELDPDTGRVEVIPGDYTDYAEEKARRRATQWQAYQRQQKHVREVEAAITGLKGRAQRTENTTIHFHYRKRAAKVARRAVTLERRLRREMESGQHIDKPVRQPHRVRAGFAEGERAGDRMLAAEGVTLAVAGRTLVEGLDLEVGWGEHVVLIGPNGSGKTTLLRTLLGEIAPAAGRVTHSPAARIGYLPQRTENMAEERQGHTPLAVIRAAAPLNESDARRFLHRFLFTSDQVFTPLLRLSYGERRRLHLATLVAAGVNLLVLDEPTNHLDIGAREAFEAALDAFEGAILVATHDRYFIDRFAERVISLP